MKKGKLVTKQPNYMTRSLNIVKDKTCILIIGVIGAAFNGIGYPGQGLLWAEGMETLNEPDPEEFVDRNMAVTYAFIGFGIYYFVVFLLQMLCFGSVAEHLTFRIRRDAMKRLLYQDVQYFEVEENTPPRSCYKLQSDSIVVNGVAG